jgi:hypothetical protein
MRLRACLVVAAWGTIWAGFGMPSSLRAEHGSAPQGAPPHLNLVWVDAGRTGVRTVQGATRELQALLGRSFVRVSSTIASAAESHPAGGGWVRCVLLPGAPRAVRRGWIMGFTDRTPDCQPTLWIAQAAVAASVGLRLEDMASWDHRARRCFDRAVAVVVVHELGHLLGGAAHSSGLMAPRLGQRDLLDARLSLRPEVRWHLVAGLARLSERPRVAPADSMVHEWCLASQ